MIDEFTQPPLLQEQGDGGSAVFVVLGERAFPTVHFKQFLEVDDEVPSPLVQDVRALIKRLRALVGDSDPRQSLTDLQKLVGASETDLQQAFVFHHSKFQTILPVLPC